MGHKDMKMFLIPGWYCTTYGSKEVTVELMFEDPCIIVQFLRWKTQQDATVYQNFIIPHFKWSSTCFGQHATHHQEPETAQAASGFAYMEGCWMCSCWTLSGSIYTLPDNVQQLHVWQPSTYAVVGCCQHIYATWQCPTTAHPTAFHVRKTRGCLCSFRLL